MSRLFEGCSDEDGGFDRRAIVDELGGNRRSPRVREPSYFASRPETFPSWESLSAEPSFRPWANRCKPLGDRRLVPGRPRSIEAATFQPLGEVCLVGDSADGIRIVFVAFPVPKVLHEVGRCVSDMERNRRSWSLARGVGGLSPGRVQVV